MKIHITYITIIVAIGLTCFWLFDKWSKSKANEKQKDSIIIEKQDSIKYHVNRNGKLVMEKQAAEVNTKDFAAFYQQETKRLRDDLNINVKNLKAYIEAGFQASGSGNGTIIHNHYDSLGRPISTWTFSDNDGYLDISGTAVDSLHAKYKYTYSDKLIFAFSIKKKWFMGNDRLYGSGELSNKNAKITNSTSVLINNYRDKRFVLSAGVSYDPFRNQFAPSIHFGYALIKF